MHNGQGFTIIEVIIFIAISGALLTFAFIGMGSLARQARFSDSITSLHSTIQRQYEEVANGVNTRAPSVGCSGTLMQPGTDDCLLLGKVITFEKDTSVVKIRYVTGRILDDDSVSITDAIRQATPSVQSSGEISYEIQWGAIVKEASRASLPVTSPPFSDSYRPGDTTRTLINSVAFLRSPRSTQIIPYYFASASASKSDIQIGLNRAVAAPDVTAAVTASVCIYNPKEWSVSPPLAAVVFGQGRGSSIITANFMPSQGIGGVCA